MKTIKIDNTTTHVFENTSPGPLNASIKAAMENVDFGLGVATSFDPSTTSNYCRCFYKLSDTLLFCIIFTGPNSLSATTGNTGTTYYAIYNKDNITFNKGELVKYVVNNSGYFYSIVRNSNYTINIQININYILNEDSTLKTLYGITTGSSVPGYQLLIDNVNNIDGTTTKVAGLVGNGYYNLYNLESGGLIGLIRFTQYGFSYDNKVLFDKALLCNSSNTILGILNSYYIIYGDIATSPTSTKLLIDIDGTRYRQVVGNVWTKDNE